jgi:hypothetical protein
MQQQQGGDIRQGEEAHHITTNEHRHHPGINAYPVHNALE